MKDYEDYQDYVRYQQFIKSQELRSMPPPTPPPPSGTDVMKGALRGVGQGATFGFSDELQGAAEGLLRREEGETYEDAYARGRNRERELIAKGEEDAPVLSGLGNVVGGLASGGAMYKAAGMPNTFLGSAALGGAEGGLDAAGRAETADDAAGKMMLGIPAGMAAGGAGYGVAEIYNRFRRGRASNQQQNRVDQAKDLGIELTPAQRYGDQALHRFEASQMADPGYGKAYDEMAGRNQEQYNRIAANTLGIDANTLTEAEMGKAAREISKRFKDATSTGDVITFDEQWLDDLADLEAQYRKVWGKSGATPRITNDILDTTMKGHITPTEYQRRYSQLGKDLEKAKTAGDMHKVELYGGLRNKLDDLVDRNAEGLSDQFKEARRLYKNKILLQKPGVVRTETGDVSPLILGNNLRKDKRGYLEGENTSDLYNMARVAQGTKSGIGDSGTATRSKDLMDFVTAPVKERVGRAYLNSNIGHNVFGPPTGKGGAINPFIYSLMQSPEAIQAALEEEERRKLPEH